MSIRSSSCAVAALVLLGSAVLGQTASQLPAFEVVSIKPRTGDRVPPPAQAPPDRFVRSNTTVVQLVQYAYGMQEFQVIGGPDWVRSNRYEVSAKAESAATADRMAQMVKRMLAERFGLQTHTEMREQNTYYRDLRHRPRVPAGSRLRSRAAPARCDSDRGDAVTAHRAAGSTGAEARIRARPGRSHHHRQRAAAHPELTLSSSR